MVLNGMDWKPRHGRKNIVATKSEYKNRGKHISTTCLLYCWGSLFGVAIKVSLDIIPEVMQC